MFSARRGAVCLMVGVVCAAASGPVFGQSSRLPSRANPPKFDSGKMGGIFFTDVKSALSGELPKVQSSVQIAASGTSPVGPGGSGAGSEDPMGWKPLISAAALEDLVKGAKLRLDKLITTPTAFAGGGYIEARKEFSLLSLLFAIIENYPGDVRWKASAAAARSAMERTAANTKVGSRQVYDESKKRLQDLDALLSGSPLSAEAKTDVVWENLIDISSLMKLLEWAHGEEIAKLTASEDQFKQNQDDIGRYAELVATLGRTAIFEKMPYADDAQFVNFSKEMINEAQQIGLAVRTGDAELARTASAKLGQSCTRCHESFR